MVATLRPA